MYLFESVYWSVLVWVYLWLLYAIANTYSCLSNSLLFLRNSSKLVFLPCWNTPKPTRELWVEFINLTFSFKLAPWSTKYYLNWHSFTDLLFFFLLFTLYSWNNSVKSWNSLLIYLLNTQSGFNLGQQNKSENCHLLVAYGNLWLAYWACPHYIYVWRYKRRVTVNTRFLSGNPGHYINNLTGNGEL